MLFDTHAHLNSNQFRQDRDEVIQRAKENGVTRIVNIGINRESIQTSVALAEEYDFIYSAAGWHPHNAKEMRDEDFDWLKELSKHEKVVAIGEIGLDYYRDRSPRDVQQDMFRKQIQLAKEVNLPIIIHDRDAHQDVMNILREENAAEVGGIIHCFSGSVEMAQECIDMNFYISLGGPITFKNARVPREVAKQVPIERLLIETDSPYLTPEPYRGKRNESGYVRYVAEEMAQLRGLEYEELCKITYENAMRLFKL